MKTLCNAPIIALNPNDFKGLKDRSLQEKVRKISTIELSEPTLLEDIVIELHMSRSNYDLTSIFVMFFGKDVHSQGEINWPCMVEPFEVIDRIETLYVSESSLTTWYGISNHESLLVERIGFYSTKEIAFTPIVKADELIGDENGFLDMK